MGKYFITLMLLISITMEAQQAIGVDSIQSLIQTFQYRQAIELINNNIAQDVECAKLYYFKGLAYKGLQKYPEAIYAFEKALKRDSLNFQIASELANCCKLIGNYQLALKAYEKAALLNPNNSQFIIEEAGILTSLEQYPKAIDIYLNLLQKDTINIFLLRNIAKTYDNLEMTDTARMYCEKAVTLYPNDFQSVYRLANIYIKQEKHNDAVDVTNKYRIFDKNNMKINRLNAYAYYLSGKNSMACQRFKSCIETNDTSIFSYKYLGLSYYKLEKYDSAKVFLEKSFLKDSLNAQTCYALGITDKYLESYPESSVYLNKTLEILRPTPKFESEVLQNLAESYNKCRLYQKGLETLLSANRIAPNDTLLKFRIAVQYDEHFKNTKAALKYYKEFMKTRPLKKEKKESNNLALSYYDAVEKRIKQLSGK